jgi:hypothetical protein
VPAVVQGSVTLVDQPIGHKLGGEYRPALYRGGKSAELVDFPSNGCCKSVALMGLWELAAAQSSTWLACKTSRLTYMKYFRNRWGQ